jgi:HEAT repeat protein
MSPCPTCGKPVDPLRAPAVSVRGGKVVSFCSKDCAGAPGSGESRPVIAPRAEGTPIPKRRDATPPPRKLRTPATGVTTPAALYDSGPVIEIIHEPASGVVTSAPDARSGGNAGPAARSETSGAIQIADTGHIDDYVSADDPPRRRGWVALAILVVLGGAGFAAYQLGYLDSLFHQESHAAARPSVPEPHVEHVAATQPAPTLAPAEAVDRARTALHGALASHSKTIQRLAASALARTGASEAVVPLIASVQNEPSDAAKIEIYYALARGADKRGTDGLVASLSAEHRDDRLDAARRLAMLGDKRATPLLVQSLDVPQQRLGAALSLAYLADARAITTLQAIRADAAAKADDKARAAIALGIAGDRDVEPALHELLADAHFNAFAAASLAELHDPAAKPVLVRQLEVPALRVGAARALRRLDPDLDVGPLLPGLVAAISSPKDTEQLQAAEAVLILAGPPAWSERE